MGGSQSQLKSTPFDKSKGRAPGVGKLEDVFADVNAHKDAYIARLAEVVSMQSVSADVTKRDEIRKVVNFVKEHLEALGAKCEVCELGNHKVDGKDAPLPPALLGQLGDHKTKKTLLIYGHLDVQPAKKCDGWDCEPFELKTVGDKLVGRGSSDDKGPSMAWLNALESMIRTGCAIPVNLKFVFEGMEESGSVGLEQLLRKRPDFTSGVDYVCICDNYWLGTNKPCLTYGLRGVAYYSMQVTGAKADMHSGLHGGVTHEPLSDVIWMMNKLTETNSGRPEIPALLAMVKEVTEEETKLYEDIEFNVDAYCGALGANLKTSEKVTILMNRWRNPSLSLHGIEGAFSDPGAKTVIPAKVTGKFSIRLVPDMEPPAVDKIVEEHVMALWSERKSPNKMKVETHHAGKWWLTDPKGTNFQAAHRATKAVYGVDPDYTREGGSIPITIVLQELTKAETILLPIGASDDNPHSQNEKLDVRNYIEGTKLLAAYLCELGKT